MAQGLRGRVALVGAGVLFCTGLVGCMNDDKKVLGPPPKAKGSAGAMMPGGMSKTTTPTNNFTTTGVGGTSVQPTGYSQPGGMRTPTNGYDPTGTNPGAGMYGRQVVPGQAGVGAPMPGTTTGANSVVPQVTPSNYTPTSYQQPPTNYGTSATPVKTAGGIPADPTMSARGPAGYDPQPPALDNPTPPGPPAFGGVEPSVSPYPGPASPLPPSPPPAAPMYPN